MRTWLVLLAIALVATACAEPPVNELAGGNSAQRKSSKSSTKSVHGDDTDGENDVDDGNPYADQGPDAPTNAGTASSQFSITLAQTTPSANLGEDLDLDVTVVPVGNFAGSVALSVAGLPAGVTAAPATASVGAPAKIHLTVPYTAVPSAPGSSSALVVSGTAGTITATANANFKIQPKMTLNIPVNVDALRAASVMFRDEYGTPFGSNQQSLRTQEGNGIVVQVFNKDSKKHVIHGQAGFAHGSTNAGDEIQPNQFEMQNGGIRTRTFKPGADVNGYPHEGNGGPGASFRIRVDTAN